MFCCSKHNLTKSSSIIDDKGETEIQSGNEVNEDTDDGSNKSLINDCICCQTKWLTKTLTLKCYYCNVGFLRNINPTNVEQFICIGCGKIFNSLSLIVRSCEDTEESFEFWRKDFYRNSPSGNSLYHMDEQYKKLKKLLSDNNIRLLHTLVQLALAYQMNGQQEKSIQHCKLAIEILSSYCMEEIVSDVEDIGSIKVTKIWHLIQKFQAKYLSETSVNDKFGEYFSELELKFMNPQCCSQFKEN